MRAEPRAHRLHRRTFAVGVAISGLSVLAGCGLPTASQLPIGSPRVRRIGYLSSNPSGRGELSPFIDGLRELGYAEGRDYVLETRYAELRPERTATLADELVGLHVDVLVTEAYPAALAAKQATASGTPEIPVVFTLVTDPVGLGLVPSVAHPGANMTGLTTLSPALSTKRLELLKAIVPGLSRVAVLHNPDNPSIMAIFRQTETAGAALGIAVRSVPVRVSEDVDAALAALLSEQVGAVLPLPATPFQTDPDRARLMDLAAAHGLPVVLTDRGSPPEQSGYLLAVGPGYASIFRRAATFVDRIFKGAHPSELPVEQPSRFDIVVNLTSARALGLSIPSDVAAQVTEWMQ